MKSFRLEKSAKSFSVQKGEPQKPRSRRDLFFGWAGVLIGAVYTLDGLIVPNGILLIVGILLFSYGVKRLKNEDV